MSENTKRLLTLLMVVAMLVSMMPVGVSAQEQPVQTQTETTEQQILPPVTQIAPETLLQSGSAETAIPLQEGSLHGASFLNYEEHMWFSFTPNDSGFYYIETISCNDVCGKLYNGELTLLTEDDDSGDAQNFKLGYTLTAGQTYFIEAQWIWTGNDNPGDFQICVNRALVESVSVTPVTIYEGTCGYLTKDQDPNTGAEVQYYAYNTDEILCHTGWSVSFIDGTGTGGMGNNYFFHNDRQYWFNTSNEQSIENQWVAGNTYTATVSVMGVSTQMQVTIVESPLQSLTIEPITVIAGSYGWTNQYYDPETDSQVDWFCYDPTQLRYRYTAVFEGGYTTGGESNTLYYQDSSYAFSCQADQSYENQWTSGNIYMVTVSVMGQTVQVPVSIIDTPVVSMTLQPVYIEENTCGDSMLYPHYYYYWWDRLNYSIQLVDGTELNGTGGGFWYNGQWHSFSPSDNQGPDNGWTVNNTYSARVSVLGATADVSVSIIPCPIQKVVFDAITLKEYENGYWNWTDSGEFFQYNWENMVSYTVTFQDGTVARGDRYNGVEYKGNVYSISTCYDQQYSEHWLLGNTYTATAEFNGAQYPVYVTIAAPTEGNGYQYIVQSGKAIILDSTMKTEILQIPETLDGYPVAGITGLGDAMLYAKEIRIPDSVTMLSGTLLDADMYYGCDLPLKKLVLGSGIAAITGDMFSRAINLEWIQVSENNPTMCSVDGVVYNKNVTVMIAYPPAKQTQHKVPDTVTDVEVLLNTQCPNLDVQMGAGVKDYTMTDGIIYDSEMTSVLKVTPSATGSYVMPETVTSIEPFAFENSKLTAVALSPRVTEIMYGTFCNASALEEITIPNSVQWISEWAFEGCTGLKKVHVTDLVYWTGIQFNSNPLSYANDLYLNGDKITDLVIPETVTSISYNAFAGASFESVTLPNTVEMIEEGAFADCENLKAVYVSRMEDWYSISFCGKQANPLYYAHDLYVNGEKLVDLILPGAEGATVTNRVYGPGNHSFVGASIESVTVPAGAQDFGLSAFADCENLKAVYISDLAGWCESNFAGSNEANPLYNAHDLYLNGEKITDLVIPDEVVTVVYPRAFAGVDIRSLTVPETVYTIGYYAFVDSAVEDVTFAEGVAEIGSQAFAGTNVKTLELPESLFRLEEAAFSGCKQLQSVTFGADLQKIQYETFKDCTALETVVFSDSVKYIEDEAFFNTGLKEVTLPKQLEYVACGAFAHSSLNKLTVESDSLSIMSDAFEDCPIESMDLGENVYWISDQAFKGTEAAQIRIPAQVTEVSYRAFAFNPNLVSVTIPDTIQFIYPNAFEGDVNLSHVLYTGTQEQWDAMDVYSQVLLDATLHCEAVGNEVTVEQSCTSTRLYCSICDTWETITKNNKSHKYGADGICTVCGHSGNWEYTANADTGTVTVTGYTGSDTAVSMPQTIDGLPVTAFTKHTFAHNRKIESVVLPAGITEIPAEAFSYCSSLKSVTMEGAVTAIGNDAFNVCTHLTDIVLPESVTTIGAGAFANCTQLQTLTLPKNVTQIGAMAFYQCYALGYIDIPAGVTEIAYSTFDRCWAMESVTIPNTVTTIGYNAFSFAESLKTVKIPESVKRIQPYAFENCGSLQALAFVGDVPEMSRIAGSDRLSAFYPENNKMWDGVSVGNVRFMACPVPQITKQPITAEVAAGETATVIAEACGQRLSYQWYYAEPGAKKFQPVGGNSIELSMVITGENSGGRAYCVVTDVLGQRAQTETVFLKTPATPNGITLTQLPYTLTYDLRQELRTRGLEVALTFDDNTQQLVTDYTVSGYDPNVGGEQTVTVTYGDFTATFTVTVNEEKLTFVNTVEEDAPEEKIEISAPQGAVDSAVELVVEKLPEEAPPQEMPELPEVIQENTAVIYDITLEKEGEAVQPTQTVQVSIPVPEHMESKRCKVYHIADDGTTEDMNARYVDGRMVFDTDHFSYYAVVEVGGVTLSGIVTGQGDIAGTVVKLISGGEVLETVSVAENGTYRFNDVVENDYIIEAFQEGLPAKQLEVTVADRDLILDILLALLGDIDGNGEVTRADVIRLLLHVTLPDRYPIETEADINGDNGITRADVIRLLLHVTLPDRYPLG